MTHYPPSKVESDPKSPMNQNRPNPGKAATPTSNESPAISRIMGEE